MSLNARIVRRINALRRIGEVLHQLEQDLPGEVALDRGIACELTQRNGLFACSKDSVEKSAQAARPSAAHVHGSEVEEEMGV